MVDNQLVLYDQMRSAIARCAEIDEVAGIKDKAAQLEAYARVRDDSEAQRKFTEIRLRACIRIGELSRDLPHGKPGPKPGKNKLSDSDVAQFDKENVLERTGLNVRTAERYEELTGGREEQAQQTAIAAAEAYFTSDQPLSMSGLKTAVKEALVRTFGEQPQKERQPKREPDLLVHFLYSANWQSRKHNFDPISLAKQVMEEFAQDEIESCRDFIPLLEAFIKHLKERFPDVR